MKIKIASNDPQSMSQDGSSILRSLQNDHLSMIDLMVRESLQNSLDATLDNSTITKVEFKTGEFFSSKFSSQLEELEDTLNKQYSNEKQEFLAIIDKNTEGLTGDYRSLEDSALEKNNFYKLVFGLGKNQTKEGAGGSWGLGKTSYFRMGVGIVVYYSRIKIDEGYEERLIVSLIEDPKKENRLLSKSNRGIAWWGELSEQNSRELLPITDTKIISDILNIFGLNSYKDDETGTTIIIPYLKKYEVENKRVWEKSREDAIKIAVQRWYSPRLFNKIYQKYTNNSTLDCSINGIALRPSINTESIFDIFQSLYNSALTGDILDTAITVSDIKINSVIEREGNSGSNIVGRVAFREVSKKELDMLPPENKDFALAYLGIKDQEKLEANNSKVMAYSRKPGMILEYDIDGTWTPKNELQEDDCLLLGFFVPNSNGKLIQNEKYNKYGILENYLRATENADHAHWQDKYNISIVERITRNVASAINEVYQSKLPEQQRSATSGLSRKYGAIILPPRNFGGKSVEKVNDIKNKNSSNNSSTHSSITILETNLISSTSVEVIFKATLAKNMTNDILIQVLTQDKRLNKENWLKEIGKEITFPFYISDVYIKSADGEIVDNFIAYINSEVFEFKFDQNIDDTVFSIQSKLNKATDIEGSLYLAIRSNEYIPNLSIQTRARLEGEDNNE